MRQLWEQHGLWTRSFIVSKAMDLPDLQFVTDRLLRNPTDFANVLYPFYGEENSRRFEQLLRDHLLIAAELVENAKKGDTVAANKSRENWYKNADEIAYFISSINSHWNYHEWRDMMFHHLWLVEEEAALRLNKKYQEDIALYDTIEEQALQMADIMSRGIISQFNLLENIMTF
jgi:hypothetical protein